SARKARNMVQNRYSEPQAQRQTVNSGLILLIEMNGGEGGIRTHVPVTRQDAFEAPPLRPLRYLSDDVRPTFDYTAPPRTAIGPPSATRLEELLQQRA